MDLVLHCRRQRTFSLDLQVFNHIVHGLYFLILSLTVIVRFDKLQKDRKKL